MVNSLSTNASENLLKEYEECKGRLESLYDHITNGLIIRSKVSWYEKGDKSNKYFYKLLECLNKVFSLGEFSTSQRQAVVTLVLKG